MFKLIQEKMPWLAAVMLVLIVGFSFIIYKGQYPKAEVNTDEEVVEKMEDGSQAPQGRSYVPGNDPTGQPKGLNYEQAIDAHQNSRFQLKNCSATPTSLSLQNGSTIMLDGLSPDPQIVTIGDRTVVLEGFEFSLLQLTESNVPVVLTVDCEMIGRPSYNIATINLQP